MNHLVFVYGTLKQGFPNFSSNRGTRLPGDFTTVERYPFYLVGERHSPWLLNRAGNGERVTGQVFEVDSVALAGMDALERIAEADGYRRVELALMPTHGTHVITAFAYLKQAEHLVSSDVRAGPLSEYTLEHAALYRSRTSITQPPP